MLDLTDENFEKTLQEADKPVVVDFWSGFCQPCFVLSPILEKIAGEKEELTFAKVNISDSPFIAQKYGIDRIPQVWFFKGEEAIGRFIGVKPEPVIKEFLEEMQNKLKEKQPENNSSQEDEKVAELIKRYEEYAEKNGFKLNPDGEAVKRVIKGLLANEEKYGFRYCPCRRVAGNLEEDRSKICPCAFHKEELDKHGICLCGLFVK